MSDRAIKRFYSTAGAGEVEGGFAVLLDGRIARTPAKRKLVAPTRALAEAIAAEWATQGEIIEPLSMPLTRLADSALDGVAEALEATIAEIGSYAGSDLVCYRVPEPEALAARQAVALDTLLAFAEQTLGARFVLACGITHVAQPESSLQAVRAAIPREPFAVTALHALTSLSGSALLALALARQAIAVEAAWAAAHVDEDFQIERWGADEEAMRRREARGREFAAAARALAALRS
ncbi:MAG TPA: ATP12 family protein [Roseiarcus sp.]|nr:ATP12 family protein [Roseiarcus sp.]